MGTREVNVRAIYETKVFALVPPPPRRQRPSSVVSPPQIVRPILPA
jgi:hypothetical protein